MKSVVIDTNVYISSLISSTGAPAKIMGLVLSKRIAMVVSYSVLNEYVSTALYPAIKKRHGLSNKLIEEKIFTLGKIGKLIKPENHLGVVIDDPSDNKFLECAVEGGADFIISGDKHLKNLKSYQGIKIVDPAEFMEMYA